ncbi:MAG: helix-turn-helix domain-containing protein [Dehalococcoidia bacterium]
MSGHKPFKHLRDGLESTPEGRAAIAYERRIVRDLLALQALREARGVSPVELARAWDTSQTDLSQVEHGQDPYLSTLRCYVETLGGRLELRAVFPDQIILLSPDSSSSETAEQPGQRIA